MFDTASSNTVDRLSSTKSSNRKTVVGSCHTPVRYDLKDRAFRPEDVPERTKRLHDDIVKDKFRLISADKSPEWNSSTRTGEPLCQRKQNQNLAFARRSYEYNYRAEKLPKTKRTEKDAFGRSLRLTDVKNQRFSRTAEMPVHPSLRSKTEWDKSTNVDEKQRDGWTNSFTQTALGKTTRKSQSLLDKGYVPPDQRETLRNEALRRQKEATDMATATIALERIPIDAYISSMKHENERDQSKHYSVTNDTDKSSTELNNANTSRSILTEQGLSTEWPVLASEISALRQITKHDFVTTNESKSNVGDEVKMQQSLCTSQRDGAFARLFGRTGSNTLSMQSRARSAPRKQHLTLSKHTNSLDTSNSLFTSPIRTKVRNSHSGEKDLPPAWNFSTFIDHRNNMKDTSSSSRMNSTTKHQKGKRPNRRRHSLQRKLEQYADVMASDSTEKDDTNIFNESKPAKLDSFRGTAAWQSGYFKVKYPSIPDPEVIKQRTGHLDHNLSYQRAPMEYTLVQ